MPGRYKKIYNQGVYHVFNKTINDFPIFNYQYNCELLIKTLRYYRSNKATLPLSRVNHLEEIQKNQLLNLLEIKKYFKIDLLAYTLMPNHYHFLILQLETNGISKVINDVFNSLTRHLNKLKDRKGAIFLSKFKAEPVKTDDSLKNVSRYIHINSVVGNIIPSFDDLSDYPWSSYQEYITGKEILCNTKPVMSLFSFNTKSYDSFCKNQAEYKISLNQLNYTKGWH